MNRIVCIIFTVLAAVTPARGQDKSDVNSASERYLSPVRALGRSEIAGHNAGSFLLWDIPTYSEIKRSMTCAGRMTLYCHRKATGWIRVR